MESLELFSPCTDSEVQSRFFQEGSEHSKKELEGRLRNFCAALAGIFVLGGACNFGRVYLMRVAGQNIAARLRRRLYAAIMRQRISFFDQNKTGELVNRLSADSQLVSQTITQQVCWFDLHSTRGLSTDSNPSSCPSRFLTASARP